MQSLQVVELKGQRLLTTKQIAEAYQTDVRTLQYNFRYNKRKYVEGKHYFELTGEALRELKGRSEFQSSLKYAKRIYLWTEKGALLHAKSLNTDKAWEVYDWLVDFYFRVKEQATVPITPVPTVPSKPRPYQIPEMSDPILIFRVLLKLAEENGISVRSFPLKRLKSCLHGKNIGIDESLNLREINFELAFELAHAIVHRDCGDIIHSPLEKDYNLHAERMAELMLILLNTKVKLKIQ